MAEDRRADPRDDLTTSLVQAEVDGERLTSDEIASFFILLAVAGNETTRNAISHGVLALTRYPEQREKWWSTRRPVPHGRRGDRAVGITGDLHAPHAHRGHRARRDQDGQGRKGDAVVLLANRDESKFANPWLFDIARNPNPHQGFGGGGTHFCLGANLARREISVTFEELRRRMPDIVATEAPTRLASSFIHGIKQLPVTWTPPN